MNLRDTKIFIPEIPKEWTQRMRSGHTNIWNDPFHKNGLPEVKLDPPERGLYAERFEDGWYWVCGCSKCLENNEAYSYITCYEHDRCITCRTHRTEIKESVWGHRDGFQCNDCRMTEKREKKEKALKEARKSGHSELDCMYNSSIICPVCASKIDSDDIHEDTDTQCNVCDAEIEVELSYDVTYTTTLKKK